ncbi:hypothetical protein [Plesiomonas sp. ZOR0011]|uniref:hypothetical protein n=1 Tax=Plesiomonas sp. ZOR0011 TaxID=1339230 RepID=UPI0006469F92|nr:hypothetical protein [Plesiomonas sp. ZOR0011]
MKKEVESFEFVLKHELDVISWNVSESQLINIAKDIANFDGELEKNNVRDILISNGVLKYFARGFEGLSFSRMQALLKAAKDVANNNKSEE